MFLWFLEKPFNYEFDQEKLPKFKKNVLHILTAARKMRKAKVIEIVLFKRYHDSLPIEMQNIYGSVPYELFRCYF